MKKILLLGGANTQIPSILTAKKMGYYTITCDYLPDNPGHKFADEYHNVSTTDKEAVLALAKELQIDGMLRQQQQHMFQRQWDFRPVLISQ